jgi:DNA-binding IclR family transcriptional regulator
MSSQPNQSLIDGLGCLQFLASARNPVGCRELARRLDLNPMRANRLLKTLAEIGLAQQDAKKKYAIGPGIHALTAQSLFGSSVLKQALPLIKAIDHPGLTVAIGVLWRGHVTYLYHGSVDEGLEHGIGRIGLVPCFNSSIGRLLLAYEADSEIERLHSSAESGMTKQQLLAAIRKIRKQGYAVVGKEPTVGLAVPIGMPPAMGIALAGIPANHDLDEYVRELNDISNRIVL